MKTSNYGKGYKENLRSNLNKTYPKFNHELNNSNSDSSNNNNIIPAFKAPIQYIYIYIIIIINFPIPLINSLVQIINQKITQVLLNSTNIQHHALSNKINE